MTTILVIEDQELVRANLIDFLEEEGFDAVGFNKGSTGMIWALKNVPDLIICDIAMPEMDGYSVLSQLRQHPAMEKVPFIFLTAKADKSSMYEGMCLGADDYFTKPFRPAKLLEAIEYRLRMAQLQTMAIKG